MPSPFTADALARVAERNGDPDWLRARREEAFARFESLPWPDGTAEEWRKTDIRALDIDAFDPEPSPVEVSSVEARERFGEVRGFALQLDADIITCELDEELLARGVVFAPFGRAAAEHAFVKDALGSVGVGRSDEKFHALSAAFAGGGALIHVPRGVVVDKPIASVRRITRAGVAMFPRVLVIAEEGAEVTVIDQYVSTELDGEALCVANVEIIAHPASVVSYLAVQDFGQSVWHLNVQRALLERDATVRSLAATLGGRLSRSKVDCILAGQGANSEMLGLYFGDRAQHIDNRSLQDHRAPNTTSDLFYKGALKGTSHAVYSGLVRIAKGAQKTNAQQTSRNLLLSPGAGADPKPFLEIEANDVRCTHGVSVGRPDREVLFYLQSRGLDAAEAERVFVTGFLQEVIDRVHVPEVRAVLERAVADELALEA